MLRARDTMAREFVFDCPECGVETDVDADVRDELLADGCVLCESPVDADAFVSLSGTATER
jgi:hypothetical protein